MPKIDTHNQLLAIRSKTAGPTGFRDAVAEIQMGPEEGEPISHGDSILILLREFYIRDNKTNPLIRKDEASVTVSFHIKTGDKSIDVNLGTFDKVTDSDKVRDGLQIPVENMLVLPLTEVSDYFVVTTNAIKDNDLKAASDKITKILDFATSVANKIPGPGTSASPIISLTGSLINLVVALSPEQALINDSATFLVSGDRYKQVSSVYKLTTGLLYIVEKGYSVNDDGTFVDVQGNSADPTRIVLEIIKPAKASKV